MSINPFHDENGSFRVLVNDEEQHSLRSAFTDVRAGWRVVGVETAAPPAWMTSSKIDRTFGRNLCATGR